jgi:cysteine desulfurase/selenocysteine lyase
MTNAFSHNELLQIRADTPALGTYAHFSHGSNSLPPECVFDRQRAWLSAEAQYGTHRSLIMFKEELDAVRRVAASLIGAQEHQIVLVDSTSRAWALAFAAACARDKQVDVIATEHEWGANVMNILAARAQGRIAHLRVLYDGDTSASKQVDAALKDVHRARMPIVALQAVNPVDGAATDMSGIGKAVHDRDGLLFVDASHAVGQLPVDVGAMDCDVLVFPARKWLRGAKGVSVLYLSDRALRQLGVPPSLDIASAAWVSSERHEPHLDRRRFEAFEFSPGVRLALKAACEYAIGLGLGKIATQAMIVRQKVEHALADLPVLRALSIDNPTALMTYRVHAPMAKQLLNRLEARGVNASLITTQYSRWALQARGADVLLRLTPHYFTTDAEIMQLRDVLGALPAEFRLPS